MPTDNPGPKPLALQLGHVEAPQDAPTDSETHLQEFAVPQGLGYLLGMQRMRNIYAGTADPDKVARRHAKNKIARKQRRVNRHRGK